MAGTGAPLPVDGYKAVFDDSPNPCLLISPGLIVLAANRAYLRAADRSLDAIIGRHVFEAFPEREGVAHVSDLRAALDRVVRERRQVTLSCLHYPIIRDTERGPVWEDRYWSATHTPILGDDGELRMILQHPVDITELHGLKTKLAHARDARQDSDLLQGELYRNARALQADNVQLAAERQRLRRLFEQAPGFVAVGHGPDMVFDLANEAYYRLVGHRDIIGKPVREALPELEGQGIFELLDQVYRSAEPYVGRAVPMQFRQVPDAPLTTRFVDFIYQPIVDAQGRATGVFVQGHDVTEAHELAQEVSYQAAHDPLTGLYNRREFERRLLELICAGKHAATENALLYLDLDQFKLVNDTCGHQAGDELLRQVARLLSAHAAGGDVLARLGGDEFALLLQGCPRERAVEIAEAIRLRVSELDFVWERRRYIGSVSIGVVSFVGEELGLREVLSSADSACFLAKEKGRNRVHAHHVDDQELLARRREMDWISRLHEALEQRRLLLYVQRIAPLHDAEQEQVRRWEVLLRLRELDGSIVPPMAFIPAAERYNLMPALDRYVIRAAIHQLAGLSAAERARTAYSINLSATTLNESSFAAFVRDQLAGSGVAPSQLCFEVTETAAVASLSETGELMREVKALGCTFALDDFGSGMSSFAYLKQLPVDYLKIDGAFIRNILDNPVDAAMVEAIARVARVMELKTVAEFVENEAMCELLRGLGVEYAQGYGIHKPEPLSP